MPYRRTKALIVRSVDYRDSDRILTVLTPEEGKMTVTARGCRKRGSPLAPAVQILTWSDLVLSAHRDRWSVREASVERRFPGVERELERLSLGCFFAECAEQLSPEGVSGQAMLSLTLNSLHVLDRRGEIPLEQVRACFELSALSLSGYAPALEACAVCGRFLPDKPALHLREGVLHCDTCRASLGDGISMPIDHAALRAMRHVVYEDPKRLFSFRVPSGSLRLMSEVCEAYLLTQLERGFRTLDFYKALLSPAPP